MVKMRWRRAIAALIAALLVASCGSTVPPPSRDPGQPSSSPFAAAAASPGPGSPTPGPPPAGPPIAQQGLLLTEVSFAPASGEAAFVEIANSGLEAIDTAGAVVRLGSVDLSLGGLLAPLAPEARLLVLLDGMHVTDGTVIHAWGGIELDPDADAVALFNRDGANLDRVAWGDTQPGAVSLAAGGMEPATLEPGTTIGRAPGVTGPGQSDAWVPYVPADASPGRENPMPTVGVLLPLSGAVLDGSPVVLAWYPVPGAVAYRVQVASDPTFASSVIDTTTTEPQVDGGSLAPGDYSWRVLAQAADGAASRFSEPSTFETRGQAVGAVTAAARGVLAAADDPGAHLAVPLLSQHKDTAMLLLERNVEGGPHAWDADHLVLDPRDPADNKNCFIASLAMVNHFFGGDLSQDRIGYEMFRDRQAGPEWDLPYGTGLSLDQATAAVTFALGVAPTRMGKTPTPDQIWSAVTTSIRAGRPVVAAGLTHTFVFTGYEVRGGRRLLSFNDPWHYPGRSGTSQYNIDANNGRSAAILDLWLPPAGSIGRHEEPSIRADSDRDGMVDFDETERFGTNPNSRDGDGDGLLDKQDIVTGVFDPLYGYAHHPLDNTASRDFDFDGIPTERDADSDSGGCRDGEEDTSLDGHRTDGETWNFDVSDDQCGSGVVTFTRTQRSSHLSTDACPDNFQTSHITSTLSMVVNLRSDGTAIATVNHQRSKIRQAEWHCAGDNTYYTTTFLLRASGRWTRPRIGRWTRMGC